MPLFFHKKPQPLTPPAGFGIGDVQTESSICTGETTIGFYDPAAGKLLCAVVARTPADCMSRTERSMVFRKKRTSRIW